MARIPQWTLGERMAKARRDNTRFTQEQMASLLGVSKASISAWESDARRPHDLPTTLHRWAQITYVDYHWLVNEALELAG